MKHSLVRSNGYQLLFYLLIAVLLVSMLVKTTSAADYCTTSSPSGLDGGSGARCWPNSFSSTNNQCTTDSAYNPNPSAPCLGCPSGYTAYSSVTWSSSGPNPGTTCSGGSGTFVCAQPSAVNPDSTIATPSPVCTGTTCPVFSTGADACASGATPDYAGFSTDTGCICTSDYGSGYPCTGCPSGSTAYSSVSYSTGSGTGGCTVEQAGEFFCVSNDAPGISAADSVTFNPYCSGQGQGDESYTICGTGGTGIDGGGGGGVTPALTIDSESGLYSTTSCDAGNLVDMEVTGATAGSTLDIEIYPQSGGPGASFPPSGSGTMAGTTSCQTTDSNGAMSCPSYNLGSSTAATYDVQVYDPNGNSGAGAYSNWVEADLCQSSSSQTAAIQESFISAICGVYYTVNTIVFVLALTLMILGGALYAGSHILPGQSRGVVQAYAMGLVFGGVAGAIIAMVAPWILSLVYNASVSNIIAVCTT